MPRSRQPASKPGKERWAVKTGVDAGAHTIALTPTSITVSALRSFPAPPGDPDALTQRWSAVERTVYALDAELVQAHREMDGDFHLVLMDADGNTVIGEIPDPRFCKGSAWLSQITATRTAFITHFGDPTAWVRPRCTVSVVGVGLFDKIHGQAGVAPNGVQLHPLLSFTVH